MRHFGEHDGDPCLLLGYNSNTGNILLIHLDDVTGQEEDALISFLQRHRGDLSNVAALVNTYNEPFVGGNNLISYYQAKRAHDGNASALRQIPEFYVAIYDQQQCESWMGTSARFKMSRKSHRVLDRFMNSIGIDPASVPPEPTHYGNQGPQTVAEGDSALDYLRQNGIPIPEALQQQAPEPVVQEAPEQPVIATNEVPEAVKGYAKIGGDAAVPAPVSNDISERQLRVLQQIADQGQSLLDKQAELTGNINKVFKRLDAVDTSVRAAARNMEKAGFEKPDTPPTQKKRGKSSSQTG